MSEPTAALGVDGTDAASDSVSPESAPPSPTASKIVKIVAAVAVLAVLVYFGKQAGGYFLEFANWVEGHPLGGGIYIGGYAVGTIIAAPGSILTLLGGAIFGLGWGTLYVFCGSTLGSAGSFLIGRYLARGWVEGKLAAYPKFAAIDKAIGEQGLKIVFLLRLTPVFPFSFGNYALGLTKVRFRDYLLASLGMIPGTFLYVYYGKAIGDIAELAAGNAEVEQGMERWIFLGVGLAATIAVTTVVTRIASKALREATEGPDAPREEEVADV